MRRQDLKRKVGIGIQREKTHKWWSDTKNTVLETVRRNIYLIKAESQGKNNKWD